MLNIPSPAPLKFGYGTSNLWGGIDDTYVCKTISCPPEGLFFNSARTALLCLLKNLPAHYGIKVLATSFTCDAVTDSVLASEKNLILIDIQKDLSLDYNEIISEYQRGARILIVQNTMGKMGLSAAEIINLSELGIFVIVDNSLAYGTKSHGINVSSMGHVSLESFEVSKTLTCGWGGNIRLNTIPKDIKRKLLIEFEKVPDMPWRNSILERFQVYISSKYIRRHSKYAFLLWYFFYAVKVFRKSHVGQSELVKNTFKLNKYNAKILSSLLVDKEKLFEETDKNYRKVQKMANKYCLQSLTESKYGCPERIVSPRYPILLRKPFDNFIIGLFIEHSIDLGRWFEKIPSSDYPSNSKVNSIFLNNHIINVPTHFSLTDDDFQRIDNLFQDLQLAEY